jgi:phage terminase large subunit-like protein
MLLDNDGDALFIYTPPSLRTAGITKAHDPRHAAKLFAKAQADTSGRWATFHFTSNDNPHISQDALTDIVQDMTYLAYRQEILAEDIKDAPGALWKRAWLDAARVLQTPDLARIVVAVDPSATAGGDECGIVVAGMARVGKDTHLYVLDDVSLQASPAQWGAAVVAAFNKWHADSIIAEANNGGEMVTLTIQQTQRSARVKLVHASRGKATRAEPISAAYEQGRGHHVGVFARLEGELCQWQPGDASPNRLDALVWAATELLQKRGVLVG